MFLLDSQVRNGDDKMHISQSGRVGGGGDLRETKTKDRKIYFICVCRNMCSVQFGPQSLGKNCHITHIKCIQVYKWKPIMS